MPSKRRNKTLVAVLSALAALSLVVMNRTTTFVQFTHTDWQCISSSPVFQLQWTHSVEKELWQESYQAINSELLLTTTQFKTFGAGTPSSTGSITHSNGWLHHRVDRLLPRIHWVVSRNVASTVLSEAGEWPIYQSVDDYAEIEIEAIQAPHWHYFIQESCDDYFKKP